MVQALCAAGKIVVTSGHWEGSHALDKNYAIAFHACSVHVACYPLATLTCTCRSGLVP